MLASAGGEEYKVRPRAEVIKDVEAIALALSHYADANRGKLPKSLNALAPRYLREDQLWVRLNNQIWQKGTRLILVPRGMCHDTVRKIDYIAVMSNPLEDEDRQAAGRLVIDSNFFVWYVADGRFQDLLAGIPQNSIDTEPSHVEEKDEVRPERKAVPLNEKKQLIPR